MALVAHKIGALAVAAICAALYPACADDRARDNSKPPIVVPSSCRISGRAETLGRRELAVIKTEYKFRTSTPRTLVAIGLQLCKPTAATLDGQTAVFARSRDDEGFVVEVESPGEHTLRVEAETAVIARGGLHGERAVDIGLPGSAITTLDRFDLPTSAARIRLGGKPIDGSALAGDRSLALGPVTRLEIAWDGTQASGIAPLLAVDARTDVHIAEKSAVSRSRLTVKVIRGETDQFAILAPIDAEVAADSAQTIEKPSRENGERWIVRRAMSDADCVIDIVSRRADSIGQPIRVDPPFIPGAAQRLGTITVSSEPSLKLRFRIAPQSDLIRRESPDDAPHDAVFSYTRIPEHAALLEVTTEAAPGRVDCVMQHTLTLAEHGWRWLGKIELRPVRAEIEHLDLEIPKAWTDLRALSPEVIQSITALNDLDANRKVVRLTFAQSRRRQATISLEAIPGPLVSANSASFSLPQVIGVEDRGSQLTVTTPSGTEFVASVRSQNKDYTLASGPRSSYSASLFVERSASAAQVWWGPVGRGTLITANAQIRFGERQALVQQEWRLPAVVATGQPLRLKSSAPLEGRLRIVAGGRLSAVEPDRWLVTPPPNAGAEWVLSVSYGVPIPEIESKDPVGIPLIWLDGFPSVETTVRVWAGPHAGVTRFPVRADGPWTELPPFAHRDEPELPAMTLVTMQINAPLGIVIDESVGGPSAHSEISRVWIQVLIDETGRQLYRIRALIRATHSQNLDIDLPVSPKAGQLQALLDSKRLPWTVPSAAVHDRLVRLRIDPDPNRPARVLELVYSTPTAVGRAQSWRVTLNPPCWPADLSAPATRWQIGFAENRVALSLDSSVEFAQQWSWEHGLFRPQPAWNTSTLSRWFVGDGRLGDLESASDDATLIASAGADQSLAFAAVPRSLAWIASSLSVILLAVALVLMRQRARFWVATILLVVAVITAIAFEQAMGAFLVFAQPGLLVLLPIGLAWHLIRRIDQRHSAFLPPGVVREQFSIWSGNEARDGRVRRHEPSTVDAPATIP